MANGPEFGEGPKGAGKEGPKGAGKEGPKGAGKGIEPDGRATNVAETIFRQVSQLGGFLVVAVVAPLAGATGASSDPSGPRAFALSKLRSNALDRVQEAAAAERDEQENNRKLITRLAAQIKAQAAPRTSRAAYRRRAAKRPKR
jgi:hypothetical protein